MTVFSHQSEFAFKAATQAHIGIYCMLIYTNMEERMHTYKPFFDLNLPHNVITHNLFSSILPSNFVFSLADLRGSGIFFLQIAVFISVLHR